MNEKQILNKNTLILVICILVFIVLMTVILLHNSNKDIENTVQTNSTNQVQNEDDEELDRILNETRSGITEQDNNIYNSAIEKYIGKNQKGTDVKNMIMDIISTNKENTNKSISIDYDNENITTENEMTELRRKISASKKYNIEAKYKNGIIEKVIIEEL